MREAWEPRRPPTEAGGQEGTRSPEDWLASALLCPVLPSLGRRAWHRHGLGGVRRWGRGRQSLGPSWVAPWVACGLGLLKRPAPTSGMRPPPQFPGVPEPVHGWWTGPSRGSLKVGRGCSECWGPTCQLHCLAGREPGCRAQGPPAPDSRALVWPSRVGPVITEGAVLSGEGLGPRGTRL